MKVDSFDPDNIDILPGVRSRPTITDVARLCGVTPATVSRVLNGKQKFSASEAVRQKIFATAHKLGYVPDLSARNLNRRATRIIGLLPRRKPTSPKGSTSRCWKDWPRFCIPADTMSSLNSAPARWTTR